MPITKQDKRDLLSLFETAYQIPGEYFIGGLVCMWLWTVMREWNPYAWMILLLGIIFFILEAIVPVAAGHRLILRIVGFFQK